MLGGIGRCTKGEGRKIGASPRVMGTRGVWTVSGPDFCPGWMALESWLRPVGGSIPSVLRDGASPGNASFPGRSLLGTVGSGGICLCARVGGGASEHVRVRACVSASPLQSHCPAQQSPGLGGGRG